MKKQKVEKGNGGGGTVRKEKEIVITRREELPTVGVGIVVLCPVDYIQRNPNQPRRFFDEEELKEIAQSIKAHGDVEEPVRTVVRYFKEVGYFLFLVDGERRLRGAKMSGIDRISCLIRPPMSDDEVYLSSCKANLGRASMSPVEEALIIAQLQQKFSWTLAKIAEELGKSIPYVSSTKKYLNLHKDIQKRLVLGTLNRGLASLLTNYEKMDQLKLQDLIIAEQIRRKRPIHPNEAARLISHHAEKSGLKKRRPTAKEGGRYCKATPHAELVMRNVAKLAEKMEAALSELRPINKQELSNQSFHLLDFHEIIQSCGNVLAKEVKRIESFLE